MRCISLMKSRLWVFLKPDVAAEMEAARMKPTHRTFLALLNACGTAGRVELAYGVVQKMAAFGSALNSSCYTALIKCHKNSRHVNHTMVQKIFELLEQSKGCDSSATEGEGRQEFKEELENQSNEYVAKDQGSEHVAAVGESRTAL